MFFSTNDVHKQRDQKLKRLREECLDNITTSAFTIELVLSCKAVCCDCRKLKCQGKTDRQKRKGDIL
jgi:hypothetical protein